MSFPLTVWLEGLVPTPRQLPACVMQSWLRGHRSFLWGYSLCDPSYMPRPWNIPWVFMGFTYVKKKKHMILRGLDGAYALRWSGMLLGYKYTP